MKSNPDIRLHVILQRICKENRRKSFESERLLFIAFQISKRSGGTFWSILPLLTEIRKEHIILSLTVSKRKNRCIPCAYLGTAIFIVVIEYCNLFPSFTLFLNCFHFTFGYELIVCSKSTSFMKIICNGLAFICRNKSLFLNLDKIYCFQGI